MKNFQIISDVEKDLHHETASEIKRYLESHEKCAKIVGSSSEVTQIDWADLVIVLGGDGYVTRQRSGLAGVMFRFLREFWNTWVSDRGGKAENSKALSRNFVGKL